MPTTREPAVAEPHAPRRSSVDAEPLRGAGAEHRPPGTRSVAASRNRPRAACRRRVAAGSDRRRRRSMPPVSASSMNGVRRTVASVHRRRGGDLLHAVRCAATIASARLGSAAVVAEEGLPGRDLQQVGAELVELASRSGLAGRARCRAPRPSRDADRDAEGRQRRAQRDGCAGRARRRAACRRARSMRARAGAPVSDSIAPSRSSMRRGSGRRDLAVVGDHQRSSRPRRAARAAAPRIALAGARVEVAGRLVGEHDRRLGRRARGRSPRAGARRRTASPARCRQTVAEPDALERRLRGAAAARASRDAARTADRSATLSTRAQPVEQEELLEHEADRRARAAPTARGRTARATSSPASAHVAAVGRSSVPITCSSVDLPEPDGPTIADQLALLDGQVDAAQRVDVAAVGLADIAELERRAVTARPPRSCPGRGRPSPRPSRRRHAQLDRDDPVRRGGSTP